MAAIKPANSEYQRIQERLASIDTCIAVQAHAMTTLTETMRLFIGRNRADDCPFRVEIALGSQGAIKVEALGGKVHDLDKKMAIAAARGGFIGGGSTGVLMLVGYGVAKAIGWV